MADLPTGTVTFLFTDIVGSTKLWEQHPETIRQALVRHDALVEQIVAEQGGHVVRPRGEGDSRFAVFARATDAVVAAAALQQALTAEPWPTPAPLRVRMALHTGEADLRAGDYYGTVVNRCARLRAVAHSGQTLLSEATYALVREHPLPGIEFHDLGAHRLKDLQQPEHIVQLVVPDLQADFPPLVTLDGRPTNLPVQPTPFIGREREVVVVRERLLRPAVRLLTLTGPGGTGKTRLALQVAADLLDAFANGVWFVDLASIRDPALVATTIARTLGVKETGSQPLLDTLKASLAAKQVLLLLDNFEQVVAAAPIVAELLASASGLKALVTSRAVLNLQSEHEFPVPPLALPDSRSQTDPAVLAQYDAVHLFVQRAQAVKPDFQITHANMGVVTEICQRVDGLPLAIELAATRIKLLPPHALLARLHDRLRFLTGGGRDRPARQQTLRIAIDWSYALLDAGEQMLFRRLAVFVGGCTVEAAEAVCAAGCDLPVEVLDGLHSLLDKSLLVAEDGPDGDPCFRMLETIREFALEQLESSGEAHTIYRRHATYYLALAEEAEPALRGPHPGVWLDRLAREHGNLRAALAWSRADGDSRSADHGGASDHGDDTELRLVAALWRFWHRRRYLSEGRERLEHALARLSSRNGSSSPQLRAKLLAGAGIFALLQGELTTASARLQESKQLWRNVGDSPELVRTLYWQGRVFDRQGNPARAQALLEESLALARELHDTVAIMEALLALVWLARDGGDYERAVALLEERLALARAIDDPVSIADSLLYLGRITRYQGDSGGAKGFFEESLALARQLEDKWSMAELYFNLGWVARDQSDYARATQLLEESVALAREVGNTERVADALYFLAWVGRDQGHWIRAAEVLEESLSLYRELNSKRGILEALNLLGQVWKDLGEYAKAIALTNESLVLSEELGDQWGRAHALNSLAYIAYDQGSYDEAAVRFEQCLAHCRELGDKEWIAGTLSTLGRVRQYQGEHLRAKALLAESLLLYRDVGEMGGVAYALEGHADCAAQEALDSPGRAGIVKAVRLFGAAEALREAAGQPRPMYDQRKYDRAVAAVHEQLGEALFESVWAEGRAMTLEQAVAYALEGELWLEQASSPAPSPPAPLRAPPA